MTDVTRRGFFRASAAIVISVCAFAAPVVLRQQPQKVSQDDLAVSIVNHRVWLVDELHANGFQQFGDWPTG
jgi:hypothetical protein